MASKRVWGTLGRARPPQHQGAVGEQAVSSNMISQKDVKASFADLLLGRLGPDGATENKLVLFPYNTFP